MRVLSGGGITLWTRRLALKLQRLGGTSGLLSELLNKLLLPERHSNLWMIFHAGSFGMGKMSIIVATVTDDKTI
jgi:hypothetical protein